MRMKERKAVLEGELGTGPGRCGEGRPSPSPASVDAGCHPVSQTSLLFPARSLVSATDLAQPAALADEQTENQGSQTTKTRAQNPARRVVLKAASSEPSLSLSGLLALHPPSPLRACEAVQSQGRDATLCESRAGRWPFQGGPLSIPASPQ